MDKPFSYHIFLFPFRWDYYKSKDKEYTFAERTDLNKFHNFLDQKKWDSKKYELSNSETYNEYTYYYDFVRNAIFDTEKKDAKNKILNHYEYQLPKLPKESAKYEIQVKNKDKYSLDIKNIYLHVYSTGVALLSYHLENNTVEHFNDILKINDYGKRIYPQFLGTKDKKTTTSPTKGNFLADSIEIVGIKNTEENFDAYNNFKNEKNEKNINTENTFVLPNFISTLLGVNFVTQKDNNKIKIKPLIDDRMFTISWCGNDKMTKELKSKNQIFENHYQNKQETGRTLKVAEYNYTTNENWYQYLFNDGNYVTCQNSEMRKTFLKKHSYARWIDWGTLYGVSRYSFVCLTDENDFAKNIILTHIKTIYYQMVVLSLMQRASILRFSNEVTEISKLDDKEDIQLVEIEALNKAYLKFSNQMYFREVTAQEQGIELYDMLQDKMRIERDVKDLNREIDELYQYANMLEDKKERDANKELNKEMVTQNKEAIKMNKNMERISLIGAIFLIPTLLTGLLGMNTFVGDSYISFISGTPDWNFILSIAIVIILTIIIIFIGKKILKILKKNKKVKFKKQ